MDNAIYATLTRQAGLMAELRVVANNIANADTTGFRAESVTYAEHVARTGATPSLSMAAARVRETDLGPGALSVTGQPLDLAIDGEGFFRVMTDRGERLTRAGAFGMDASGQVVTPEGWPLLDAGGAPIVLPPGGAPAIGADGTLSVDGAPVAQVGVVVPRDPLTLIREGGTRFRAADVDPAPAAMIRQGALEGSNVDPVAQIARLIEVQRAYEAGQSLIDREDGRIRQTVQALTIR